MWRMHKTQFAIYHVLFWYGGLIFSLFSRLEQHIVHVRIRERIKLFACYHPTCWAILLLWVTTQEGRWRRCSVYCLLLWLLYGFEICIYFIVQRLKKRTSWTGELRFSPEVSENGVTSAPFTNTYSPDLNAGFEMYRILKVAFLSLSRERSSLNCSFHKLGTLSDRMGHFCW